MVLEIEPSADAITMDSDPYVIIRPEGDWDTPGVLDGSSGRGACLAASQPPQWVNDDFESKEPWPSSMIDDPPILICADLQTEYLTEGRSHVITDAEAVTSRCLELLTLWRGQSLAGHPSETDRAGRLVQPGVEPDGLDRGPQTERRENSHSSIRCRRPTVRRGSPNTCRT